MFGFQLKNLNYAILDLYVVIPFYMVKNCKQKKRKEHNFSLSSFLFIIV
ncbi:hypothetical protein M395_01265 [Enterococcus faecium T110]|nr:hypothetical protein M395_01265 [Enterococcus faecium T110]